MLNFGRNFFAKHRRCRHLYALIQARDFERAHAWLQRRAAEVGQDADYYKCLAKIAALQGDHGGAIERYEQSIAASGCGTQRFLVYGDLIRLLYLAERGADAQQLLDRALEDLERVLCCGAFCRRTRCCTCRSSCSAWAWQGCMWRC